MATRVIGLDIGTHAVRAAEISIGRGVPVLERMGQVALPTGAVVAGEVVDGAAVSAALRRLWRDVAFSSREVVFGVANARVMARMTEMPAMPDDEIRSSLQFHVQDLIPIPVDEAELDFQVTGRFVTESGEERVRLMLVAAQRQMLRTFLAAIDGAGLVPTRIDMVALALIRALAGTDRWLPELAHDDDATPLGPQASETNAKSEVIIGVGAGVTNVVVHEHGIPSFVRTVPSGGAAVTQALAKQLGTGADEAEGLKRLEGSEGTELATATLAAIEPVVGEVVGSLDFYRSSNGPGGIQRVLLAGGGSRLEPLRHALADQLGVPIEIGDPYRGLKLGKIGIDPAVVQQSGDLFAAAIGLALSGVPLEGDGRRISLLPGDVRAKRDEQRVMVLAGAGVGVFALLLVGATLLRGQQVSETRADVHKARAATATVNAQIAKLADIQKLQTDIAAKQREVSLALTGDVAWPTMIEDLSAALPPDVALTSLTATAANGTTPGKLAIGGVAKDHTSVAAFLVSVGKLKTLKNVWLGGSTRSGTGGSVTFTASAELTDAAGSTRAANFGGTK